MVYQLKYLTSTDCISSKKISNTFWNFLLWSHSMSFFTRSDVDTFIRFQVQRLPKKKVYRHGTLFYHSTYRHSWNCTSPLGQNPPFFQRRQRCCMRWNMCWLSDTGWGIQSACSEKEDDEGNVCFSARRSRSQRNSSGESQSEDVKYCVGKATDPNTDFKCEWGEKKAQTVSWWDRLARVTPAAAQKCQGSMKEKTQHKKTNSVPVYSRNI